jgi:hypothetical protein
MLTIRKKLEEQAASSGRKRSGEAVTRETQLRRKLSFRSQLLSAEANELGAVLPSQFLCLLSVLECFI